MTTFTKTVDLFSGFKNCKTTQDKQTYLQEAINKYGRSNRFVHFLKNKLSPEPKDMSEKLKIINSRLQRAHDVSADHYSVRLSKNLPEVKTSDQGSEAVPIEHINQQFVALKDVADTNDFDEITESLKTIIAQKEAKVSGIGTKIAKLFFWCTSFIPASKKNYQNIDNAQKNIASMKKFVAIHDLFADYKKCTKDFQKQKFIEEATKKYGKSFEGVLAIDQFASCIRAKPKPVFWE